MTAAVRELNDDGTFLVTLDSRDRPKDEARYDEETGERLYGKFEMPGYDEEDAGSDKRKIEMPFNELISPRLIRPGSADQNADEGNQVPAASDPDDTLVGDEAQRAVTEPRAPVSFESTMNNPPASKAEIVVPTESARQDIVGMIQDAGWRSSLGSDVGEGLMVNGHTASPLPKDRKVKGSLSNQSPTFKDFGSSPHANGSHGTSSPISADSEVPQTQHAPQVDAAHGESNEDSFPSAMSASKSDVEYPIFR